MIKIINEATKGCEIDDMYVTPMKHSIQSRPQEWRLFGKEIMGWQWQYYNDAAESSKFSFSDMIDDAK